MLGYLLKSVQLQIEDIYKSAREQTFNYDQVRACWRGVPSNVPIIHAMAVVRLHDQVSAVSALWAWVSRLSPTVMSMSIYCGQQHMSI